MRMMQRLGSVAVGVALTLLGQSFAEAQEPVPQPSQNQAVMPVEAPDTTGSEFAALPEAQPTDTATERSVPSPMGAFVRSAIVPGWGQAAYGSYFRGGVYFAAQSGSWFMLLKTMAKLREAREIEGRRVAAASDSVLAAVMADPLLRAKYEKEPAELAAYVEEQVDKDEDVQGIRSVIDARKQQREDWIALTLFWMLASGIDAFVNAHLSDFPARITAEPRGEGRLDLGVQLPVGGHP